jgi:hypothetical protein
MTRFVPPRRSIFFLSVAADMVLVKARKETKGMIQERGDVVR